VVLAGTTAQSAGSLGDYRLIILNGQHVKWGDPVLGTGAVVTYALADSSLHTDSAFNCRDMQPVDALLAANAIPAGMFSAQVDAAFQAWQRAANISFIRTADVASADIVIGAELDPVGRSFTNVATRAGSAAPSNSRLVSVAGGDAGGITRSLICLNPAQGWKAGFDGNLAVYDVRYTLMHEIGHAIGLDHPDGAPALMDYHYTEAFSALQSVDIAGAVALYGPRQPSATVIAGPAMPVAATTAALRPR
jgi:predicted Zn-dependent protease